MPNETLQFLKNKNKIKLLLVDACYGPRRESDAHNNLNEALKIIDDLQPEYAILTHISHKNPPTERLENYIKKHKTVENTFLAYDGIKFNFE